MTIIVNDLNDRPIAITGTGMQLDSVTQNDTNPTGTSVADLLASGLLDPIGDVDAGAVEGSRSSLPMIQMERGSIRSEAMDHGTVYHPPHQTMQCCWTQLGSSGSFPIRDTAEDTIIFYAWDQTDGRSSGDTGVDVVAEDGPTSAFSSDVLIATIDVIAATSRRQRLT